MAATPAAGRAQRWFWALTAIAVVAMGLVYRALQAAPGSAAGLGVLVGGILVAASTLQAARIAQALARRPAKRHGSPRLSSAARRAARRMFW